MNKIEAAPATTLTPPRHGADLFAASQRYGIPLSDWLDVSTGINPCAYPFRTIECAAFQQLPTGDEVLCLAAKNYARSAVMPVAAAGSQMLIQWLPIIRTQLIGKPSRVAVPAIGYSEHAFRWQWAGHDIVHYDPRNIAEIDVLIADASIDVFIVINAHNPLGLLTEPAQLLQWHKQIAQRGGWLIVDEAFIDPTPEYSVIDHAGENGLIVLRSLGKFFGMAGVRCGFAFCDEVVRARLHVAIGPWAVSGPTLSIATQALNDRAWQLAMREYLPTITAKNGDLLQRAFAVEPLRHALLRHGLFNSVPLSAARAVQIEDKLAQVGVRVRRIEIDAQNSLLRFGLIDPAEELHWQRFNAALQSLSL